MTLILDKPKPETERPNGWAHGLTDAELAAQLTADDVLTPDEPYSPRQIEDAIGIPADTIFNAARAREIRHARVMPVGVSAVVDVSGRAILAWATHTGIAYGVTPFAARCYRRRHRGIDAAPPDLLERVLADAETEASEQADAAQRETADAQADARGRYVAILSRFDAPADGDAVGLADAMATLGIDAAMVRKHLVNLKKFRALKAKHDELEKLAKQFRAAQGRFDSFKSKHAALLAEWTDLCGKQSRLAYAPASLAQAVEHARLMAERRPALFVVPDNGFPLLLHEGDGATS